MNAQVQAIRTKVLEIKGEYEDIAIDQHPGRGFVHANYVVDDLEQLLSLIDSLQQEQPCEGYDEAYLQEKIALKEKHGSWKDGIKQLEYLNKIYFKEQPCEDLEAEIKRYEASLPESATVDPFEGHPTLEDVARHFAEWQKDQMLKNAVKGTVCKDKKCVWIEFIPNALPDYEDIEPVKCVVIKED